ncbi:MAG: hypothetical protein CR997_01320 [Acidobacteria bacterium]|nr:MAG: hypothetical protein CR997_01320 [Acidobacteriota bacterium]
MAINLKVLWKRVLTTVFGIAIVGSIVLLLPKYYFIILLIALSAVGHFEIKNLAKGFNFHYYLVPAILLTLYGFLTFYTPFSLTLLPYLSLLLLSLWVLYFNKNNGQSMPLLGIQFVGLSYLCAAFLSLAGIFLLDDAHGEFIGRKLVVFFFFIVWMGDSFAYLIGSSCGRHKIAPNVSPNKSWEGALGNLLGNLTATCVAKTSFLPFLSYQDCVYLGVIFFLLGFFGDLIESSWKRGAGIKDSSHLFPGHGGVLDRIDSIFLTGPIFFGYFYYILL